MNREAIQKTIILSKDEKAQMFVCRSPLCSEVGAGKTPAEAIQKFQLILADLYCAYLENRLAGQSKRGRPAKGNSDLHVQIKASVKHGIGRIAEELSVSQGEVVECLFNLYEMQRGGGGFVIIQNHADSNSREQALSDSEEDLLAL